MLNVSANCFTLCLKVSEDDIPYSRYPFFIRLSAIETDNSGLLTMNVNGKYGAASEGGAKDDHHFYVILNQANSVLGLTLIIFQEVLLSLESPFSSCVLNVIPKPVESD